MFKKFGFNGKYTFNLYVLCWVGYFSTYICRLNYSAVIPELTAQNIFSNSQAAAVSSVFFICYGLGQLVSGFLGDKFNTRLMVFFGLLTSALSNVLIFFCHSYEILLILWAINGIAQSMVWSPILKFASVYFDPLERENFGINISTTVPLGTLASYGVSLLTISFLPWHYVFLTCGLIELIIAFYWLIGSKKAVIKLTKQLQNGESKDIKPLNIKDTLKILAKSGVLILLFAIVIQGTLKDSVTQWIPTFFKQEFGSKTTFSIALTMILPIINVTGAFFAQMINRKLKNEVTTSMAFFAISAFFLLILNFFGSKNIILALICMASVTNCMFAVNVMLITLVPLRFQKEGRVSTVGGFLNALAYVGCGALNIVAGKILDGTSNWNKLFLMWLILAVIAVAVCFAVIPMWKNKFKAGECLNGN